MPISLKAQVERTDKTPLPRRRARVGGLCGFPDTAERVPAKHQKTGRCASVRERCGNASAKEDRLRAVFGGGKSRKRQGRTKPRGRTRPAAVTSARSAGSFGDLRGRSKSSEKQPEGVAE